MYRESVLEISPHLSEGIQQILDSADAGHLNAVLDGLAGAIDVDDGDAAGPHTALGKGQAEVHDWIKLWDTKEGRVIWEQVHLDSKRSLPCGSSCGTEDRLTSSGTFPVKQSAIVTNKIPRLHLQPCPSLNPSRHPRDSGPRWASHCGRCESPTAAWPSHHLGACLHPWAPEGGAEISCDISLNPRWYSIEGCH